MVLKSAATVWMFGPSDGSLKKVDVSGGIDSLTATRTLETRWREDRAVLYFRSSEDPHWTTPLVLVLDLAANSIEEARWHELPPNESRLLPPEEFSFLDKALRTNGDFGVYGSVTAGIAALAETSHLSFVRDGANYSISISPLDGHGHELGFSLDGKTGEISNMAAGHSVPEPEYEDELVPVPVD